MKVRLAKILPLHELSVNSSLDLYVADYKNFNNGEVVLVEDEPTDIKYVYLSNPREIEICFDGFKQNALPIEIGRYNSQCECVLFPNRCKETDWVLFIETKYANNITNAFKEIHNYPNGMVNQIIDTVKYFRENKILGAQKKVHAIVSFPNLIEEFNSTIFRGDLSVEDILFEHKILIRGTNSALIKSEKRIKLFET